MMLGDMEGQEAAAGRKRMPWEFNTDKFNLSHCLICAWCVRQAKEEMSPTPQVLFAKIKHALDTRAYVVL